jgi:phosphopantothenoylcysteine synthetase/decarboxylase
VNALVTAGNTLVPIDRVRCITNIFTGRTGTQIALDAFEQGHAVRLLTSAPGVVEQMASGRPLTDERWRVETYQTFEDLHHLMEVAIRSQKFDVVIHSAAVSDFRTAGIYAPMPGTQFVPQTGCWEGGNQPPALLDRSASKVKSDEPELWLRLVRTPKLVDRIRSDWRFAGVLVKFKLEVGIDDDQLRDIAERSRRQSAADLMVANTLEGAAWWAYLGPVAGQYQRVSRRDLSRRLLEEVNRIYLERMHG